MSGTEYATVGGSPDFPVSWGPPPGRQYSEARAIWVRSHAQEEARWVPMRQLARADIRLLNTLRLAYVNQRRNGPGAA